ncbi:spherulation-specific family 4 protein [Streptomyces boncukensis]|uniref:Phage tail protein n=1 Tax=Streptomyces boncukensis TaxID=2711219 RepID=A0A6G4X8J7_9ACTN|nr:spherulation-specific family 4 protein [Streptomyces boncukensis]NGO73074.1 phage tail protein [Streptomyces boncukensis]
MPYLTRPGGTGRPPGASGGPGDRPGLAVPGCAHPMLAPAEWAELSRPGVGALPGPRGVGGPLQWAVLDVSGGPGMRLDPYCAPAAAALRQAGVALLGHLDMRYGSRPFGELVSEAHRFLEWYTVDGFYLAHCPGVSERLPETRRTVTTLRALSGGGRTVLAHGTSPYEGYADCADQLVTFSGSWADYRWSQAAEWTAGHPPERFCHVVHGLPRTHLDEALRIARWQGAGTVCFTDRTARGGQDPWETLPGYWDEIVSRTGPGVSE